MLCLLGAGPLAYHRHHHHHYHQPRFNSRSQKFECSSAGALGNAAESSSAFSISTFNLLCPAYRRIMGEADSIREALYPGSYMKRNRAILELPQLWQSDIVCCQVKRLAAICCFYCC